MRKGETHRVSPFYISGVPRNQPGLAGARPLVAEGRAAVANEKGGIFSGITELT